MASDHKTKIFVIALLLALLFSSPSNGAEVTQRTVILSTTTSTQDSGLLDVLIPLFEKQTGYSVKTISVGTGQALALAAKGDADVARVQPHRQISIIPEIMRRSLIDPSMIDARKTSVMIVDATKPLDRPFSPVSKCPDEALMRIKLEEFVPGETLQHIPVDRTTYWA